MCLFVGAIGAILILMVAVNVSPVPLDPDSGAFLAVYFILTFVIGYFCLVFQGKKNKELQESRLSNLDDLDDLKEENKIIKPIVITDKQAKEENKIIKPIVITDKQAKEDIKKSDYIIELRELKELLDEGIISTEQFDAKKKSILDK